MALANRAAIIHQPYSDAAVLTDGTWHGTLGRANLQHPDINMVAQTLDATNASTKFKVDLGIARAIGGIAIGPTNASLGSTWRVRAYSDAGYTALVYDSTVLTLPGSTGASLDLEWEDEGFWYGVDADQDQTTPRFFYHIIPDDNLAVVAASGQFWLVEFFDTGNAVGYMQFGRLLLGRAWRPSTNYSPGGNSFTIADISDMVETLGGQRSFWSRGQRRMWRASFPMLGETEAFSDVGRLAKQLRTSRQCFVVPDPTDIVNGRLRSFLATFKDVPAIEQAGYDLASTVLDFEEVR